jgi:hypothetical protein
MRLKPPARPAPGAVRRGQEGRKRRRQCRSPRKSRLTASARKRRQEGKNEKGRVRRSRKARGQAQRTASASQEALRHLRGRRAHLAHRRQGRAANYLEDAQDRARKPRAARQLVQAKLRRLGAQLLPPPQRLFRRPICAPRRRRPRFPSARSRKRLGDRPRPRFPGAKAGHRARPRLPGNAESLLLEGAIFRLPLQAPTRASTASRSSCGAGRHGWTLTASAARAAH